MYLYWNRLTTRVLFGCFNFDAANAAHRTVSLERAGLDASTVYSYQDLWEGDKETIGHMSITLEPAESKIFRLTVKRS